MAERFVYFDKSDNNRIQVVGSIFQGPPPAIVIPPDPAPKPKSKAKVLPKRPSLSLDDITKSITEQEADNIEHSALEVTSYSPPPVKQNPPDIADLLVETIAKDNASFYPKPVKEVPDYSDAADLAEWEYYYVPGDQIIWQDPATEEANKLIASGPRPKPKYFVYKKEDLYKYYLEKGDERNLGFLKSQLGTKVAPPTEPITRYFSPPPPSRESEFKIKAPEPKIPGRGKRTEPKVILNEPDLWLEPEKAEIPSKKATADLIETIKILNELESTLPDNDNWFFTEDEKLEHKLNELISLARKPRSKRKAVADADDDVGPVILPSRSAY